MRSVTPGLPRAWLAARTVAVAYASGRCAGDLAQGIGVDLGWDLVDTGE